MKSQIRMFSFVVLALGLSSCSSSSVRPLSEKDVKSIVRENSQCVTSYRVTFVHNDVPDWDTPPAGFCSAAGQLPILSSIATYPLAYDIKKQEIKSKDSWFYLVWTCLDRCEKIYSK